MNRKPNLFIIGAQKCGTTSLHEYLAAHADIYLSEPKEPGYFVPEIDYYPRDLDWYLGLFEEASGQRYIGESSTHYTKLPVYPGVAERIAAFVDEPPRFIYLMRDPIDRAISHYWHEVRKFQEHRPIEVALAERIDYRAFGNYPMQLEPYFSTFGREAVYTLTFEELVRSPESKVGGILRWLGLEPELPEGSFRRLNARPEQMQRVRGSGLLDRVARSRLWDHLSPRAPRSLKDFAKRLGYRKADPAEERADAAVARLRPEFQPVVRELEQLLGRTFPEWSTTLSLDLVQRGHVERDGHGQVDPEERVVENRDE